MATLLFYREESQDLRIKYAADEILTCTGGASELKKKNRSVLGFFFLHIYIYGFGGGGGVLKFKYVAGVSCT